ncbi:hypothetical protein ACSBR2_005074 [Camellia fascicularis]
MAQQRPPPRPWFRLASMSRPVAPTPTPAPAPAPAPAPVSALVAPQPRLPFIRPASAQPFVTPTTQPTQPPPAPAPQEPTQAPPPAPSATAMVSSVPSSPIRTTTPFSSSVPSSPKPRVSAPSSPQPKPVSTSPKASPPQAFVAVAPPPPTTTTITSSVPTSPIIRTATPIPSSSLPTSPPPKPVAPTPALPLYPINDAATTTTTTTVVTRLFAPKPDVKPPPLTSPPPKTKPLTPPPSPLTLPSAQLKSDTETIEQKTILVQETIEKPKAVPPRTSTGDPRGNGDYLKRDVIKGKGDYPKKLSDSEEFGMRIITIAGDNKGAIMELNPKKNEFGGSPQSLKKKGHANAWKDQLGNASSGEEGRLKSKDKAMAASSPPLPLNTYMNSNVQGVNNSILYNCSCTHHDPGVHLSLSRKANGKSNGNGNGNGNGMQIKEGKNG